METEDGSKNGCSSDSYSPSAPRPHQRAMSSGELGGHSVELMAALTPLPSADTSCHSAWSAMKTPRAKVRTSEARPAPPPPSSLVSTTERTDSRPCSSPLPFVTTKCPGDVSKRIGNSKLLTKANSFESQIRSIFSLSVNQ